MTAIVLDPAEVATDRVELDLNTGAIRVQQEGIDWGDAQIAAYMAEAALGQIPVDSRLPNRTITIPLILGANGPAGFSDARAQLQAKVALFQRERGWLRRGTGRYADIVTASLKLPDRYSHLEAEADVILTLEAIPDFYGDEIGVTITDDFSTDTLGNYTIDNGATTLSITGGQLVPANTGNKRLHHTASPDDLYDFQGTIKHTTPASLTGATYRAGVEKRVSSAASIRAYALFTGGAGTIIAIANGGSGATICSMSVTLAAATSYWFRLRVEGNKVTVEHWTSAPTSSGTPAQTATGTLAGADATLLGEGVVGHAGIYWDPFATSSRIDDFTIEPNTYVERTAAELVRTLYGIEGDYPGRVRIVVDEADGESQLGLLAAFRSRHYSATATARLAYEAEALTLRDAAVVATLSGASGGATDNVVTNSEVRSEWTAILSTDIGGVGAMTHTGSYRVWVRAHTTASPGPQLRFVWGVGDLTLPSEKALVTVPGDDRFYLVDLGEIRLDAAAADHRWQGEVQAKGAAASIDKFYLVPVDDGYSKISTPLRLQSSPVQRATDSFTGTTAGNALNGRAAPRGGTWATSGEVGDLLFSDDNGIEQLERATSAPGAPRRAILGSTAYTDTQVEARIAFSAYPSVSEDMSLGLIARWVDSTHYALGRLSVAKDVEGNEACYLEIAILDGTYTTLVNRLLASDLAAGTYYLLRLVVLATGRIALQLLDGTTSAVLETIEASSSVLATGGALDDGMPGIHDQSDTSAAVSRYYDEFTESPPRPFDAVLHPSRAAELRTDGVVRQNADGAGSRLLVPIGDLPRIPPSGLEERPVELFLKASRGDLDQAADDGIDDIRARVYYRPSWLFPT